MSDGSKYKSVKVGVFVGNFARNSCLKVRTGRHNFRKSSAVGLMPCHVMRSSHSCQQFTNLQFVHEVRTRISRIEMASVISPRASTTAKPCTRFSIITRNASLRRIQLHVRNNSVLEMADIHGCIGFFDCIHSFLGIWYCTHRQIYSKASLARALHRHRRTHL